MVNVIFNGRLGADAELKKTKSDVNFITFRVAVNEYQDGEEKTSWLNVKCFEERQLKLAEYLKKGSLVSVTGKEQVSLFTNKNGEIQISRDVTAYNVSFIRVGNKTENADNKSENTTQVINNDVKNEMSCGVLNKSTVASTVNSDSDDDLPF